MWWCWGEQYSLVIHSNNVGDDDVCINQWMPVIMPRLVVVLVVVLVITMILTMMIMMTIMCPPEPALQ